jgi:small conductance mechanosensitive channel
MSVKELSLDLMVRYGFQVLGAVVIVVIGVIVSRWVGGLVARRLDRRAMEPPIRALIVRAVRAVVLLFTLVVALDKFGFQVAPLVAGIGVAGLGLGFALQPVLSNLIAGLTIIITKPFRVGEHISLLGVHGDVSRIELSATTLVHPDRSQIVIPNRKIVGEILHNFGTVRQLELKVGVAHTSDLGQVLALAREVVAAHPRVLRDPVPVVGIVGLADSAISIGVAPWVKVADYADVHAELYQALLERFRAQAVEIPYPQRAVRLVTSSGSA